MEIFTQYQLYKITNYSNVRVLAWLLLPVTILTYILTSKINYDNFKLCQLTTSTRQKSAYYVTKNWLICQSILHFYVELSNLWNRNYLNCCPPSCHLSNCQLSDLPSLMKSCPGMLALLCRYMLLMMQILCNNIMNNDERGDIDYNSDSNGFKILKTTYDKIYVFN